MSREIDVARERAHQSVDRTSPKMHPTLRSHHGALEAGKGVIQKVLLIESI